jgi:multiple sugar transport system permease protein
MSERRLAWTFTAPAILIIGAIAIFPLGWTIWESLHQHDLRMPWLGRPFVGLDNYIAIARDARFWSALAHTTFFAIVSIVVELVLGLTLALAMNRVVRMRGIVRASVLLPWAIPTVVAGLVTRFMFESQTGIVNASLVSMGLLQQPIVWFVEASTAWVPVILADVWKTTPFVALLLLAGLQGIPEELFRAARVDGAGAWRTFRSVTLPLLRPALSLALLFRALDAFRVFDALYVLTEGGPANTTETLSLYAYKTLMRSGDFGYGSTLAVATFLCVAALALVLVRLVGREQRA